MSGIVNYINSWWYAPENTSQVQKVPEVPVAPPLNLNSSSTDLSNLSDTKNTNIYLISVDDLLSVKLKPVQNIIPAPARNMPHINKFQLHMLNQAQLQSILSVKLKPVKMTPKPKTYPPRHPVLQELLTTRALVY